MTHLDPDAIFEESHNLAVSFSRAERHILWRVLLYYNGMELPGGYYIGRERPPSLRELVSAQPDQYDILKQAVERLRTLDILHEESAYVCRKEVKYRPTRTGRQVIDDLFGALWRREFGGWGTLPTEKETDSVLAGEQNEGLLHRYGVRQFLELKLDGAKDNGFALYPTGSGPQPDAIAEYEYTYPRACEVQTGHNDHAQIARKYRGFVQLAADAKKGWKPRVYWLFPDGETAARTINILERRVNDFDFPNAPFENPSEYRPSRLDSYLDPVSGTHHALAGIETFDTFHKKIMSQGNGA